MKSERFRFDNFRMFCDPIPKNADPVGNYRDAADEHMKMQVLDR